MIYLYLLVFKIRRKLNEELMPKNREKKALFELRYEKNEQVMFNVKNTIFR